MASSTKAEELTEVEVEQEVEVEENNTKRLNRKPNKHRVLVSKVRSYIFPHKLKSKETCAFTILDSTSAPNFTKGFELVMICTFEFIVN